MSIAVDDRRTDRDRMVDARLTALLRLLAGSVAAAILIVGLALYAEHGRRNGAAASAPAASAQTQMFSPPGLRARAIVN